MVREALKVLNQRGLVETRQGSGSRVAHPTSHSLSSAIGIVLRRGGLSFEEICDARALIEPEMAARAAHHRSATDVIELERAVERLVELRSDPASHVVADLEFHHLVARISGHGLFSAIAEAINGPVAEAMRVGTSVHDAIEQSDKQHRGIAHSIISADADGARAAMHEHITFVRSYLVGGEIRGPI
jgi:DNA-binding FadR family transcriptional regulator